MFSDEIDPKTIEAVNKTVYQKFPNFDAVDPVVSAQDNGQLLFIYRLQAEATDAHIISLILRVMADKAGTIIKISSSR